MINIDDLDKIMEIVEKHDFSHFEFEQESSRIVIDRNADVKHMVKIEDTENNMDQSIHEEKSTEKGNSQYIKSTLAGTFYLRKEKGSEPFVKLHDIVQEHTVVGLVEVMKLFNEVEAGVSGEITDILVKDGDFVEYGQPLFEVKGSDK
ncbi:biotin/lipoyl-binding protein [Clostridium tyrobutyricum]|jgi:acetyl-CoA carboxylase biotin carboxyl carrier protein|uniref:Biotin carboxyl carrier protein of acetyl-CoA carboxylase n=1 Tax=Clostridium tyrobutyricum DIVETGP TaxID=1408889 RepID=W6N870_CLOTY|nr:biotin/lipoyl-containing protein [Clostridium tyrobutyricum]AND84637.1 biotin carboxyl carrier protein of acetyl-coa carboxylase [Clostridium tyrobutyricum]ANP69241.1 acetyl-CoA carboxylase biotin carboxyl carrier protein subunit [Clostridium tyrobutyricum]MBR9648642.1 biotin/lipoyl-binding protein [Clostridium tyrobutyricum]MBV4426430.1 biotin/lipoyl-binding protein [Clostridium tyrobutyricum]MBV4427470.1 biotin/lipoyl-binding protein [Clostridium tyrobutyricum]